MNILNIVTTISQNGIERILEEFLMWMQHNRWPKLCSQSKRSSGILSS